MDTVALRRGDVADVARWQADDLGAALVDVTGPGRKVPRPGPELRDAEGKVESERRRCGRS